MNRKPINETGLRISFIGRVWHPALKNRRSIEQLAESKGFILCPSGSVSTSLCVVNNLYNLNVANHAKASKLRDRNIPFIELGEFLDYLFGNRPFELCKIETNGGQRPEFRNSESVMDDLFGRYLVYLLPDSLEYCV